MNFSATSAVVYAKNAVVFIRVSSKSQTDGVSLEAQLDNINRWAESNGITILKVFTLVKSGRDLDSNPTFNEMMQFAQDNKENGCVVVVNSVDRFGRNSIVGISHLHSLLRSGIHFCSVSENLYVHSMRCPEIHMFTNLIQASHIESDRISARVRGANEYLKARGWNFGKCPITKKIVYKQFDRSAEGLEPKQIRTFEDVDGNDKLIVEYIKNNLWMSEHTLYIRLLDFGFNSYKNTPLSINTIKKIRKYLIKTLYTPTLVQDIDMSDMVISTEDERITGSKRSRDDEMSDGIDENGAVGGEGIEMTTMRRSGRITKKPNRYIY